MRRAVAFCSAALCVAAVALAAPAAARLKAPSPGPGWRKVRLEYEARVSDDATFEAHPEYEAMPRLAPMHCCGVRMLPETAFSGIGAFRHFVWSGEWRAYAREMWLPPGVEELKVEFKGAVETRGLRLVDADDGRIEVNGDFGLGPHNYSGLRHNDRNGRVEAAEDGAGLLNNCPGGATGTEPFPLAAGVKYRLVVEWSNFYQTSPSMRVSQYFYDAGGLVVKPLSFSWYARAPKGHGRPEGGWMTATNTFVAGEGVVAGGVTFYEGLVKSYRIDKAE